MDIAFKMCLSGPDGKKFSVGNPLTKNIIKDKEEDNAKEKNASWG